MNVMDILTIWGAILSTTLGVLKISEIYRDRRRILVGYRFIGLPEEGNDIILSNPGKSPIMISHYELFWSKSRLWRKRIFFEHFYPEDGPFSFTIPGHSRHTLNFSHEDYFEPHNRKKGNLYIRLHITGKKWPTTLLVYSPLSQS